MTLKPSLWTGPDYLLVLISLYLPFLLYFNCHPGLRTSQAHFPLRTSVVALPFAEIFSSELFSRLILSFHACFSQISTPLYFYFWLFRAAHMAYGISQARGQIGTAVAGLQHSHSNVRSEPCLWPTPQLMAMLDP